MDERKLIHKLRYLFARNKDLSTAKKLFNIALYLHRRIRVFFKLKPEKLNGAKDSYAKRKGEPWVILQYKRIINPEKTPIAIGALSYVTPETFLMQCKVLKKHASVISLPELIERLDKNLPPPPGTVILTFDGGHSDFFLNAMKPLLENGLSATVCLPTGYLGTKALLLDDMIATALLLFSQEKVELKPLEGLREAMFSSLSSTFKDGIPTAKSVQSLFALLLALNLEQRSLVLKSMEEQLNKIEITIPEWQDFLSWTDVEYLTKVGFNFTSMLHTHPTLPDLNEEMLEREKLEAERMFAASNLPTYPTLACPYGIYTRQVLKHLHTINYKYMLGPNFDTSIYEQEEESCKVLRRVYLCEDNSNHADLFLSRIWDF